MLSCLLPCFVYGCLVPAPVGVLCFCLVRCFVGWCGMALGVLLWPWLVRCGAGWRVALLIRLFCCSLLGCAVGWCVLALVGSFGLWLVCSGARLVASVAVGVLWCWLVWVCRVASAPPLCGVRFALRCSRVCVSACLALFRCSAGCLRRHGAGVVLPVCAGRAVCVCVPCPLWCCVVWCPPARCGVVLCGVPLPSLCRVVWCCVALPFWFYLFRLIKRKVSNEN